MSCRGLLLPLSLDLHPSNSRYNGRCGKRAKQLYHTTTFRSRRRGRHVGQVKKGVDGERDVFLRLR